MKHKEQFLFTSIIYTFVLLVLTIMGSITYKTNNVINNDIINDLINDTIIIEDGKENTIIFNEEIQINNYKKYNKKYLAYGGKNQKPFISILNEDQNKVLNSFVFENTTGTITELDYNGIYLDTKVIDNEQELDLDLFISGDELIPFYKKQLTFNYTPNRVITPKYLVIHETANRNKGADANAHYRYWSTNPSAKASTHFVVDSNEIYQMLELNQMAWHVGDNKGYSNITNTNSIGIEICVNKDGDYMLARKHTIELTITIMNELGMTIDQLVTHNDASGKYDPIIMFSNNLWADFVLQVAQGLNKK